MALPLIPGASLLGFWGAFEGDVGDDTTPRPYPLVTPSRVGTVLLPFRCPHCSEIAGELADPVRRDHYLDPTRGFYFCPCPACRKRFRVDWRGTPLERALPAGAACAPARCQTGDMTRMLAGDDQVDVLGPLALLGVLSWLDVA